ncbi:uncharacterized protein Dana_GF25007, isoform C [Drosophila ananassae]|uniref:Uncharacterized protein, isoform C n=1 Tax=Drosophila ananassae TaxID=7217 RepID=B3M7X7_DROAN|nr:FH2 domain-containing protein 1 [Drosophila ananassae]EDV38850.2 uncharacterized protein Dana_GF25007, isoform C [Drosophila ananassae]
MDSRIGLDYIVENRDYIAKLGAALDTQNATVKKQVFELLSALCAYSPEGYARAIETLEFYKNLKKQRYRFKIVINELELSSAAASPPLDYQAALLAFINCVIISAATLQERIRIRNEFIGLKVLPLLNNLRKVAQSVGDIIVQLDVFVEQQECDEAQSLQAPDGINLNSHLDVFYAILRQVADTPQEVPFLNILQHLLRIDPKEALSDIVWDTTERLVHRATLLESHEDAVRLLRTPSSQKFACQNCRSTDASSPTRKPSQPAVGVAGAKPAPPPPPPPASGGAPPPPPPPLNGAGQAPPPPPPPLLNGSTLPPPPPPPSMQLTSRPRTPDPLAVEAEVAVLLPQLDTPAPKAKMKTINWGKIPHNKVVGKQNIWAIVASNHKHNPMQDIDWNEMEGLFCLQTTSAQGSPKLGRESNGGQGSSGSNGCDTLDRKSKKECTEITLLDGKRSLNVNIFLKQFRTSHEEIIQLIRQGAHEEIGAERLRGLLKIMPEVDELDMLKSFNGDKARLGNAEKFLLQLLEVPNYKLRIESMLLKEEFAANVAYLEPCINSMLYAGDDLLNNKILQEVLYMVVVAGNFLNSGGYAGNAAGVKLASLQKLTDIRANKPGMNLIHFVALQAERRKPELLQFTSQLSALENASKTTSEQINNEINTLDGRIGRITRQIEQPATDTDIKEQMADFLLAAKSEMSVLQSGMKQVEAMRLKLSDFFCEDAATFRLEECFKIFQNFCDKFRQAVKENERRQQQEQQATLRRKQREEQMARRAKQIGQAITPVSDSEHSFLGDGIFDPRASPALSRRHLGSGEISNGFIRLEQDGASPDITPNGSLRRRRSRVLAEEDDLMEFLRSSTGPHDGHISRERKAAAYGSLDRSWARRARSGSSSRKRPDLLNIDFGMDRERASSPAPLLQQQQSQERLQSPLASAANTPTGSGQTPPINEDAKPRISREWRQKIETWLQSNENDEKQNEEYKRKRRLVNANRRSLENETENERKLDPLPEEKIMPSTTTVTPTNTPTTTNPSYNSTNPRKPEQESGRYQRVYADWKPSKTLEQTDVVANLQAIADAQPQDTLHHYRRQRPQEQTSASGLHSIAEEDRRKTLIQKMGEQDRRSVSRDLPPKTADQQPPKSPKPQVSSTDDTFASLLSHHKTQNEMQASSKEVDADNIETPPVSRRVISTPTTTVVTVSMTDKPKAVPEEKITISLGSADQDVPGHFDRHALGRRTRRYKRPTDYSSGNEELLTTSSPKPEVKPSPSKPEPPPLEKAKQKERTINKLEKVGRHISSINQEDVREAIRNLKSPTGTPERPWSPPREITPSRLKLTASGHHHELNDEGFEETQSLVSDTPSHGKGESTNSSCNEGVSETPSRQRPLQKQKPTTTSISQMGSRPADRLQLSRTRSSSSTPSAIKSQSHVSAPPVATVKRSVSANRPLRMPNGQPLASATPLRSASAVRRSPQEQQVLAGVERSSSRNSLRSSRSSINSGASTQTVVRRLPSVQRPVVTVSVDSSPSKRPLAAQNLRPTPGRGVPASRSSSSGSSVGPSVILVRSKMGTTAPRATISGSTSFKENQSQQPSPQSRMSAARSVVLVKNAMNQQQQQQARMSPSSHPQQRSSGSSRSVSSFMRPTASSTTKRQK